MPRAAGPAGGGSLTALASISGALREAGVGAAVTGVHALSGGCIHHVLEVWLADGGKLVAKTNDADLAPLFAEEVASLEALRATGTVDAPTPLVHGVYEGHAVLIMTRVAPGPPSDRAWRRLGEALAALHHCDAGARYGFDTDNHLGATPQPNGWHDDWVAFNAEHRLGHQLRLARDRGALPAGAGRRVEGVIARLESLIPRRPRPALLHGDLWSGNALPAEDERIAVIDPACSVGDGWADVAMMRLFGGFSEACFAAYTDNVEDHEQIETRIAVYQLYHVLNHVNLFGGGYVGQAMALAELLAR